MSYLEPITSLQDPVEEPTEDHRGSRIRALRLLFFIVGAILVGRLWFLQIADGDYYRQLADYNRFRLTRVDAPRGVIYDRNGEIVARNRPNYAATITPADLPTQPEPVFRQLGRMLGLTSDEISERLKKGLERNDRFSFITIKSNIGEDLALILEERHRELPGVHIIGRSYREYAAGSLTSHILGYVGAIDAEQYEELKGDKPRAYRPDDRIGQTNLEGIFEPYLRGFPSSQQAEVDVAGRVVRVLREANPQPGHNLVLTLDLKLQRKVGEILSARLDQYGTASAVVLDPRTGQVLALVHLPSYDANVLSRGIGDEELRALLDDPRGLLFNGAIASDHSPGSVFQAITAASALQEGVIRGDQKVDCPSALIIPSRLDPQSGVRFAGSGAKGEQDVVSALANSCEAYFFLAGGGDPEGRTPGLGVDRLMRYAREFGLGEATKIGLHGEIAGFLDSPAKMKDRGQKDKTQREWYKGDTYTAAVGQDYIRATTLQLANAFAAIANGGTLYQPQLVREIVGSDGKAVRSFQPEIIRRVAVSPENLALVREGLRASVLSGQTRNGASYQGVASNLDVPGLNLAGTVASVEFVGPEGEQLTHGWFAGFGPYEDPRVAIAVFVEKGRGASDAGEVAKAILSYYLSR